MLEIEWVLQGGLCTNLLRYHFVIVTPPAGLVLAEFLLNMAMFRPSLPWLEQGPWRSISHIPLSGLSLETVQTDFSSPLV